MRKMKLAVAAAAGAGVLVGAPAAFATEECPELLRQIVPVKKSDYKSSNKYRDKLLDSGCVELRRTTIGKWICLKYE